MIGGSYGYLAITTPLHVTELVFIPVAHASADCSLRDPQIHFATGIGAHGNCRMMSWLQPSTAHFDQVVRAYSSELFQYASWLTRDRHRAEDILQEAFARAWKHWDQADDEAGRRSWLYTIVRNEFLREAGRLNARREDPDDDEPLDFADGGDFTLGVEVRDLLTRLPEKFLEPLLLQNLVGMSCEEIAAVMGLSTGATMTRLTRARLALRDLIRGAEDPTSKPALRLIQSRGGK